MRRLNQALHQCTGIQARLFFSKMIKCFKGKITQSKFFFSAEATRKKRPSFKLLKNAILGQNCRNRVSVLLIARGISLEIRVYVR